MTGLVLLRPVWLVLLPMLGLLALWLWWRGPDAGGWQKVMPARMLAAMAALGHLDRAGRSTPLLPLAAAAVIAAGMAGPAMPRPDAPALAQSGAILIAVDMSPSVAGGPALSDAKAAAAEVLWAAPGRPVGLILFAGEAYEVSAPTADPAVLESQIAVLAPDTMPGKGSRPASALAMARAMLAGQIGADVILISDGGGLDQQAIAEARRLRADGVALSSLIVAGAAGGAHDPDGLSDISDTVAPARDPTAVLSRVSESSAMARDPELAALQFRDLGPFVAGTALLLLLPGFRRGS